MEDTWLTDRTQTIIKALADIATYRNGIPNYREEDENGFPNREEGLSSALLTAVHTATTILAAELDVAWQAIDRDRILRHGQVGYHQLLVRYGLATPQPTVPSPRKDDPYQPKPLGLLDDLKATWTFANFDVGRPLQGAVTWEDVVADEDQQRRLLAQALEETARYAVQPQGWLLIAGPIGAGKAISPARSFGRQSRVAWPRSIYRRSRLPIGTVRQTIRIGWPTNRAWKQRISSFSTICSLMSGWSGTGTSSSCCALATVRVDQPCSYQPDPANISRCG
jgi:hypothetical protein